MMSTARPRFRTDLVAAPVDDGGLRFVDVHDPDSGNGFRFFEVEYSLACAMDGERDVAGLVRWAKEELGVEPSATEVDTVISTLGELGYLEGAGLEGAAGYEPELVPGVVAVTPPRGAPVEDVELGFAGGAGSTGLDLVPAVEDVELGVAGGPAAEAPAPIAGGPDLGPAGARDRVMEFDAPTPPPPEMPTATLRPVGTHAQEEDGPTNLPQPRAMDYEDDEVSVDLSDHLAISASDVKEAVRASKVMAAVDVPKDVLDELEASEARARDEAAQAAAAREAQNEAMAREAAAQQAAARDAAEREAIAREALAREQAESKAREAAAQEAREAADREAAAREAAAREAAAREAAARPATGAKDLPAIPVGVSKKKPELRADTAKPAAPVETPKPVEPRSSTRPILLFILLLAVLGGAYYVWTQVLKKPLPWEKKEESAEVAPTPTPTPAPTEVKPAPPPPPPPTAVLAEKAGEVSNIVAGQIGVLSFVIADGTNVAVGDPVLRFAGNAADEKKLSGLADDIERRYPKQIEAAQKALDKATKLNQAGAVKVQQGKIDEVNSKLQARLAERTALQAKLDGLTIKAPIAGVVKLGDRVAKGTRTTADQQVASVTGPVSLVATFAIPPGGKTYSPDASVRVGVQGGDQKANCTVGAVDGANVTVTCPGDAGLAPGTTLVLE